MPITRIKGVFGSGPVFNSNPLSSKFKARPSRSTVPKYSMRVGQPSGPVKCSALPNDATLVEEVKNVTRSEGGAGSFPQSHTELVESRGFRE